MNNISSPEQTGQKGTTYEDKVNAYFMACLLTQTPPFHISVGLIERIDFQVRADHWLFDDTLLSMRRNNGDGKVAVSVKSGSQILQKGINTDLNFNLWQQFCQAGDLVFDKSQDFVCLVQPPVATDVSDNMNTILLQAREQDHLLSAERQKQKRYSSEALKKIFGSFRAPEAIIESFKIKQQDQHEVISYFLFEEMDFEKHSSRTEQSVISICQKALSDPSLDNARNLYERLCLLPRELAPTNGFLDVNRLVGKLNGQFKLVDFPSFRKDWKLLQAWTESKIATIHDQVGSCTKFSRGDCIQDVLTGWKSKRMCVLQGPSGAGKTVLAKKIAQQALTNHHVIWMDSADFQVPGISQLIGLEHSLKVLFDFGSSKPGLLIIDGAEKLSRFEDQQRLAALLINALQLEDAQWKVLITVPVDHIESLYFTLSTSNVHLEDSFEIPVSPLSDMDFLLLSETFPAIIPMLVNDRFRNLSNNLKLLDKLLYHLDKIAEDVIEETAIINLIWREEIEKTEKGLEKALFLKTLAEKQADSLALSVSVSEFDMSYLGSANELVLSGFLKFNEERFSFKHDIYSDWSIYKLLIANSGRLVKFLEEKHYSSPMWARAIRLYGIGLLEKKESNSWLSFFNQFSDRSMTSHTIVQDLLLESLYSSSNALELLSQHQSLLFANNGELFNRLISIFLMKATTINPEMLAIARDQKINTSVVVEMQRLPVYIYWTDFILFIHANLDTCLGIDFLSVSKVGTIWLKRTPAEGPCRQEAAGFTLSAVKHMCANKGFRYGHERIKKEIYSGLFEGYLEDPAEVEKVLLQLSRRIKPNGVLEKMLQYSDGPYGRVDDAFREVCLDQTTLSPLFSHNPDLASEILLAVMLNEQEDDIRFDYRNGKDLGLFSFLKWNPPFYLRGPFLDFLRIDPKNGLKFICKLTDFCTNRWIEVHSESHQDWINVTIDGHPKKYLGDVNVFLWHRDPGNAPDFLVSALMAAEQFFYELIEQGHDITKLVRYVLLTTNSIAVLGLLLVVGKRDIRLYHSALREFLPEYDLYNWDFKYGKPPFDTWSYLFFPRSWHNKAEEWRSRTHRFFPLKDAVLNAFLYSKDLQEHFVPVIDSWKSMLGNITAAKTEDHFLIQIIPQFNTENYSIDPASGDFRYHEPAAVTAAMASKRKNSIQTLTESASPFTIFKQLTDKTPVPLAEINEYLLKYKGYAEADVRLSKKKKRKRANNGEFAVNTNRVAVAALLIVHKESWQAEQPEMFQGIRAYLFDLIESQLIGKKQVNYYGLDYDWNMFVAMALPEFWFADFENPVCRRMVAIACTMFSPKTAARFFEFSLRKSSLLSAVVVRVYNLILLVAGNTCLTGFPDPDKKYAAILKLVDDFEHGRFIDTPLTMATVRAEETRLYKKRDYLPELKAGQEDFMRAPGLKTEWINALLNVLPLPIELRDEGERTFIIDVWKQAVDQVVYQLGEIHDFSAPVDQFPDEFVREILKQVSTVMLQVSTEDGRDALWKPIFNFGILAPQSITILCSHFYFKILQSENFVPMSILFRAFFDYTQEHPRWTNTETRHEDFRLCLYGMGDRTPNMWTDDWSVYTALVGVQFKQWFGGQMHNPHAVKVLLDFVPTPSGIFMLSGALYIFNIFFSALKKGAARPVTEGKVFVGFPDHTIKLASCLNYLWEKHSDLIINDNVNIKLYKELIQYLVSIRNPVGIELQGHLMS